MDICTEKDERRETARRGARNRGRERERTQPKRKVGTEKPVKGRQKTEAEDSWKWVRPAIMRRGRRIGEGGGYGSEDEETEGVTMGGDRGGEVGDEEGSDEGRDERNREGRRRGNVKEGGKEGGEEG